jgi:hypothetical protein
MKCNDSCHYKDKTYVGGINCCYHGKVLDTAHKLKVMGFGCPHYRRDR